MENVVKQENENWIESITAGSGLTNPLHRCKACLDMPIQVLDSRRSRSRASLTTSNLGYYNDCKTYMIEY